MRLFFDTSVLVAALLKEHPAHSRSAERLQSVLGGTSVGVVSAHSLAEAYSTLTRHPTTRGLRPEHIARMLRENVAGHFEIVALTASDYLALVDEQSSLGTTGGAIYDALLMHAASLANVDSILTLNERDFRRVYPSLADKVSSP